MKLFTGGRVLPLQDTSSLEPQGWKGRWSQTTTRDWKTPSANSLMTGTWALKQTFLGCLSCISFLLYISIYFCSHLWHPVCPHHPCRCWLNLEPTLQGSSLLPQALHQQERGHGGSGAGGRGSAPVPELGLGLASSWIRLGLPPFSLSSA